MFGTLLAIAALFAVLAVVIAKVDGLTFLAPKSARGITDAAAGWCSADCRLVDGRCPLTGSAQRALNCPLWKFVEADVSTMAYGNPFVAAMR